MEGEGKRERQEKNSPRENSQPAYIPPSITTYSSEEILEQAGPAQACSPSPCGIF